MKKVVIKKTIIIFAVVLCILIAATVALFILYDNGYIVPNNPTGYEVRGVDVSSYQGNIDWNVLSKDIDFAYIKATEGSSSVDPCFGVNWQSSQGKGIRTGAYHFFSFESSGETQANNFIANVTAVENMLPPAVDVEFYGSFENDPPSRSTVAAELKIMLQRLREHYGMEPVIYSTRRAYEMYISGDYPNCDIWIRDILVTPTLPDRDRWTIWQYSEKGKLEGYHGTECFIDMNVFYGKKDEFERWGKS